MHNRICSPVNSTSNSDPHLAIRQLTLLPGCEWQPSISKWLVLSVTAGAAYWMNLRCNRDLQPGSVLVVSNTIKGIIRSSQLAETRLRFFHVNPDLLTGLATMGEQRLLQHVASQEHLAFRILPFQSPLAEKFQKICERPDGDSLALRLQLLSFFVEALGRDLRPQFLDPGLPANGAKSRLAGFLHQVPADELMNMDFDELAQQMCCTPRHLSRTFHQVMGISFRQKQAEIRLTRARELLATTQAKVLDVALESGYQSLSLFNLMFKRRFGMTPTKWRQTATHAPARTSGNPLHHGAIRYRAL